MISRSNSPWVFRGAPEVLMLCFFACLSFSLRAQTEPTHKPLATVTQDYGRFPLPSKKTEPAWSGWEVHGSVSAPIVDYSYWNNGQTYQRSNSPNAARRFIRPDGTFVYANGVGEKTSERPIVSTQLFQLGLNRQMSWGGLWRFSAGYYRSVFRLRNDDFSDLGSDEIRVFNDDQELAIMTEAGFHYVFMRRRRFRPYLGVNLTVFPYYDGVSTTSFIEGDSREIGLVERFSSTEYFPPYLDISFTVGFQYQINERFTAGAFLWANGGADLWLDAPLGVEVRYSLKKRQARYARDRWY